MPIFTGFAAAALGAIVITSTFLVGAYTDPWIEFDRSHKRVQA